MVPDAELSHLTDEEYLVYRAKEQQDKDSCAAKCWLITAQSLFPKNFDVQFEVYQIEKAAKNVKEAARCLDTMLKEFSHISTLWQEGDAIMAELKNTNDSQPTFLVQLLRALPEETQKEMIKSAADRAHDTMTHCSLMLLLTSTFPDAMKHHGLKLVDTLITAEKQCISSLNPYRRKLVCDLLPKLLRTQGLEVRPKTLYQLLTLAVEFYITYVTAPAKSIQMGMDNERNIDDPWAQLFNIVQLIGWTLCWELVEDFTNISNRELILQRIQSFVDGGARLGGPKGDGGEDVKQVLYTTLVVFLHALIDYTKRLYPELSQDGINSTAPVLTLVEAFVKVERDDNILMSPTLKRSRPSIDEDPTIPLITISRTSQASVASGGSSASVLATAGSSKLPNMSASTLSQALITAIKCWDLLNCSEQLRAEFVRVLDCLSIERWLAVFTTDRLIYEGRLDEASRELRHALSIARQAPPSPQQQNAILISNIKLASVLYGLNNLSGASEAALSVVDHLTMLNGGTKTPDLVVPLTGGRRHLHLLALTRTQCLQFTTTLLIYSLRIVVERRMDDQCIGQLVTLLQYEWPKYELIFEEMIHLIKKHGGFTYQRFYSYVINPDMLEEFMYLSTREGGQLQLDIIPISQSTKHQRTISTRGADRGSKQDFKQGMRRQMLRSDESVETNIINFLIQDRLIIHENLI